MIEERKKERGIKTIPQCKTYALPSPKQNNKKQIHVQTRKTIT